MAYTTPMTATTGQMHTAAQWNTYVRDNFAYIKGQGGAVTIEDRVNIPLVSGTNGRGLRFGDDSSHYATLQALDVSSTTYLFFAANRVYSGTAWQQLNARAGGALLISANTDLAYNTFPAASSTPTEHWRISSLGNMGIGTTLPQGRLHGQGAIGGFLYWEFDGVDGTTRTIIPNSAGDVVYGMRFMSMARCSDTTRQSAGGELLNGGNFDIAQNAGATDILNLRVNADGSCDVRRRAGSTYSFKVALWLLWL